MSGVCCLHDYAHINAIRNETWEACKSRRFINHEVKRSKKYHDLDFNAYSPTSKSLLLSRKEKKHQVSESENHYEKNEVEIHGRVGLGGKNIRHIPWGCLHTHPRLKSPIKDKYNMKLKEGETLGLEEELSSAFRAKTATYSQ
ncbi:hypothetical protein Tco_0261363 [Tanacetum coccineum]